MSFVKEFLTQYGMMLLYAVLTAAAGWLGAQLRRLYARVVTDETKRSVAQTCVAAVEQLYRDLHGDAKKQKAMDSISAMLAEKQISVTPLELEMLIESAVAQFNRNLRNP